MKNKIPAFLLAALLTALSGCDGKPVESLSEGTAPVFVQTLEGEYDAIIPASFYVGLRPWVVHGTAEKSLYFSMEQNGLWGLMDETGVELLPCQGEKPVFLCSLPQFHWVWFAPIENEALRESLSSDLEKATGHTLCPGHGGSAYQAVAEKPGEAPRYYGGGEGLFSVRELELEDTLGDTFFPTNYTTVIEYEGDPSQLAPGGFWNFSDIEGNVLCPGEEFEQVGWFCDEALAPVQKDGKWAYINKEGQFVTEFIYDSCWGGEFHSSPDKENAHFYAYSMWEGTAVVCREGKWGVLDQAGKETIPCAYDSGAPYPGGAILKKDGQWGIYLLNE